WDCDTRPGFEKPEHRSMIEDLGADTATARPGRNDDGGHAYAQSDRGAADKFVGCPRRRQNGHGMIEEAIVLVEMQNEDSGLIEQWIRGESAQQLFDQLLATGGVLR